MDCEIEQMSWRQIIGKYGLIIDNEDIFFNVIKDANTLKRNELATLVKNFTEGKGTREDIIRFYEENSENIDKIKYIMLVYAQNLMIIERDSGEDQNSPLVVSKDLKPPAVNSDLKPEEDKKRIATICNETYRLLRDAREKGAENEFVYGLEIEGENDAVAIIRLNLLAPGSEKELEEDQRRQNMKKQILLGDSDLQIYDMIRINPNGVLYGLNWGRSTKNAFEYTAALNINPEKTALSDEEVYRTGLVQKEEYCRELARLLDLNLGFMDLDNFVLSVIKANVDAIDSHELTPEEQEVAVKNLDKIFTMASKILQKGVADDKESVQEFRKLREAYRQRKVDGKYITRNDIPEILEGLKAGKYKLEDLKDVILNMLGKIPGQVVLLNESNFMFAIRKGLLQDEVLYNLIVENKGCDTNILIYALSKEMLSKDELINLYMQKNVSVEQIRMVEERFGQLITLEEVVQSYMDEYEQVEDLENQEKARVGDFETLAAQARAMQEPGFEKEKVEEVLYNSDSQDLEVALLEFYKNFLVSAKQVLESCGTWCIRVLRPVDIRNLYLNKDITIEDIEQNIIAIDEEKAIHLICQIFPGREYSDELNRLIQSLSVEHEQRKGDGEGHRRNGENGAKSKGKIDVSAIAYKYGFYESLDPECEIDYLPKNGYAIFTLPNVKYRGTEEPCVIVEPMFDKSHKTQRTVAAQDKSMWIIPLSLWREEKSTIIGADGRLNIERLRELYSLNKGKMTKMHHSVETKEKIASKKQEISEGKVPKTGWPFRVFNLARESREYPDEEISQISDLAISLEESMIRE